MNLISYSLTQHNHSPNQEEFLTTHSTSVETPNPVALFFLSFQTGPAISICIHCTFSSTNYSQREKKKKSDSIMQKVQGHAETLNFIFKSEGSELQNNLMLIMKNLLPVSRKELQWWPHLDGHQYSPCQQLQISSTPSKNPLMVASKISHH